jgi:glucose-6-phosphate-specific signal transduction histidine kinase
MLVTEAYLGSLFLQPFFYGLSTATYLECLRALVVNADTYRASMSMRRLLLAVSSLMFIVSLTHNSQFCSSQTTPMVDVAIYYSSRQQAPCA